MSLSLSLLTFLVLFSGGGSPILLPYEMLLWVRERKEKKRKEKKGSGLLLAALHDGCY